MALQSRIQARFQDYSSYHQTAGNQATHMVGIPMIVLSILGLMGHLDIVQGIAGSEYLRLDGGTLTWALAMVWYLFMDWKLGLPFGLVSLGLYFVGRAIPVPVLWGVFILGWIIQFFGHIRFEKKSPAFYKNAEHLLVGPFWIFAKMTGYQRNS